MQSCNSSDGNLSGVRQTAPSKSRNHLLAGLKTRADGVLAGGMFCTVNRMSASQRQNRGVAGRSIVGHPRFERDMEPLKGMRFIPPAGRASGLMRSVAGAGMVTLLSLFAGGCVSSTLDAGNLRADSRAGSTSVSLDEPASRTSAMVGGEEVAVGEPLALLPEGQATAAPVPSPNSAPARASEDARATSGGRSGVDIIREKASRPAGGPTTIGLAPEGATSQLSSAEIRNKAAEMERSAAAAQGEITDAELAARQAAIAEMRRKATTHYESTLDQIE